MIPVFDFRWPSPVLLWPTVWRHPVFSSQLAWFQHRLRTGEGCFPSSHLLFHPLAAVSTDSPRDCRLSAFSRCLQLPRALASTCGSSERPPCWAHVSTPAQWVGMFWVASLDNLTLYNLLWVDSAYHVKPYSWDGRSISVWSQHSLVTQDLTPKIQEPFLFCQSRGGQCIGQLVTYKRDGAGCVCVCARVRALMCIYTGSLIYRWKIETQKDGVSWVRSLATCGYCCGYRGEVRTQTQVFWLWPELSLGESFIVSGKRKWDWSSQGTAQVSQGCEIMSLLWLQKGQ